MKITDGAAEFSFLELYSKERLSQLHATCNENVRRVRQRQEAVCAELASAAAGEGSDEKDRPAARQLDSGGEDEGAKACDEVAKAILEGRKALSNEQIEKRVEGIKKLLKLVMERREFLSDYITKLEEENKKMQTMHKELASGVRGRVEELVKANKKCMQLHEELGLVGACIAKVKRDMCYFKIPKKIQNCVVHAEDELLRRKVFFQVASELAVQIETLFDEEARYRAGFLNKYGKYMPRQIFPQLGHTVPTIRLSAALSQGEVQGVITETQRAEVMDRCFRGYMESVERSAQHVTTKSKLAAAEAKFAEHEKRRKDAEGLVADVEAKLAAANDRITETETKLKEAEGRESEQNLMRQGSESKVVEYSEKLRTAEDKLGAQAAAIAEQLKRLEEGEAKLKEATAKQAGTAATQERLAEAIANIRFRIHSLRTGLQGTTTIISDTKKELESSISSVRSALGKLAAKPMIPISSSNNRPMIIPEEPGQRDQVLAKLVLQSLAEMRIPLERDQDKLPLAKLLECAMGAIVKRVKKLTQTFRAARDKLITKTKKDSDMHVSTMMSIHESRIMEMPVGQSALAMRASVVPGLPKVSAPLSINNKGGETNKISYERFEEGAIALFFRMGNKLFQAINHQCPYYFVDPAQQMGPEDCLVAGRIRAIRPDKRTSDLLQLPRGMMAHICNIDVVFKTTLKP